jgi:hypothetical protein
VRTFIRAALASVIALAFFVGPVSAATTQAIQVAQAGQTGTVTGQVTGDNGQGISGANVLFDGPGTHQSVQTDDSGNFSVSVPAGLYTITVNKAGFQTGTTEVAVAASSSVSVNVALTAASLNNLGVIGRTSSVGSGNAAKFNISSTPSLSLNQQQILERDTPDLTQIVNEVPGITIPHASSNPNQSFVIRGLRYESTTEIDGHPVASGTGGTFLTNYTSSAIFSDIDVTKGTGLNGPTAGESGAGIVNLRTPDFSTKDGAFIQGGFDQYGGTQYDALANVNFMNNKIQFVFGRTFSGYRGPTFDQTEPDESGATIPFYGYGLAPTFSNAVIPYIADFSDSYNLNAELAKMRVNFSDSTSLAFEFLGLQGGFNPQGGAYGQFVGYGNVPLCLNGKTPGTAATCTDLSTYNSPGAAAAGLVGQAGVPLYAFYPGSFIEQNQPNFNADFKTTLGNDTILFRPYTAAINRLIDGTQENRVPGDDGAWYQVTNVANCQAAYTSPTAANGGAQGPCFAAGVNPVAAYIGSSTSPVVFATTSTAPTCTVAAPCYTTPTAINNAGQYGYGSPYTTLEIDHLAGYTFSYIHPVGANTYNISFDHNYDDATDYINDASPLAAGCTFVLGSGLANAGVGAQPTCPLPQLRPSPLSVPETFSSVSELSATAQLQLTPKFEFDFGGYFTYYDILGQQENPAIYNNYLTTLGYGAAGRSGAIPVVLSGTSLSNAHFDPHFGLLFRPTRDWVIRATAGSSQTIPYASLVSGFVTYSQGATSTTVSQPNFNLLPETLVNMDLGSDWRTPDGTVLSGDIYNIVIHNPWISTKSVVCLCALPGLEPTGETFSSQTLNGAQQYAQGVEFSITNEPKVGFGYRVNTSFERNYYLDTPAVDFGGSPQVFFNGNQFVSTGSGATSVPYSKGYAELQYALANNGLFRIGADYEGPNNSYNAPAFWIFDAGAKINTGLDNIMLGASVENLTSVNFNALLARGLEYQGLAPEAATPTVGGYTYTNATFSTALVPPPPFTIRVTLSKQF